MEEIRQIRNLKRLLEREYGNDSSFLAERLVAKGITEITDELRCKINYLKSICESIPLDDFWCVYLISSIDESELRERYKQVVTYLHDEKCKIDYLVISCHEVNDFATYLRGIGFNEEQIKVALGELIKIGSCAKSLDEARMAVKSLECFELSEEDRNYFICENFSLLFNDYSRKIDETFSILIERFGKDKAYSYLCENPMVIRLGIENS